MVVTSDRNAHVVGMSAALICLVLGGCGDSSTGSSRTSNDPHLSVTVLTGTDAAQADMQVGNGPAARYVADSGRVVYVSPGLYSSTCPPRGTATLDGETITLTVEDSDGNCTSDAVRDTFRIEPVSGDPRRLVVEQVGQQDIRLDLSS